MFHSLVPQVDNVVVRVDCVISDEDSSTLGNFAASSVSGANKSRHPISSLFRLSFSGLSKPIQSLTQLITPSPRHSMLSNLEYFNCDMDQNSLTHHSSTQVLKFFDGIKLLRIELPNGGARHYLLQPIIAEYKMLEALVLTDSDGQWVLSMNKEQLEEHEMQWGWAWEECKV